jgi:SAM-dependent methyltransferase
MFLGPLTLQAEHFEALEASRGLPSSPANLVRVARTFGEDLARWAFGQWELRKRARAKFARADEMLFDRDGLEMASHEDVARFHAYRFPRGARVADLTCGIGSDLIALAREGQAIGFELNPVRAEMARYNLSIHGLEAQVAVADALAQEWDFDYAFADPTRRPGGTRSLDPERFEPNPRELAERMRSLRIGAIKLSPMLPDDFLRSISAERIFLSHERECREVLALVGRDFMPGGEATGMVWAFHTGPGVPLIGETEAPEAIEEPLAAFLEADPAAIRAHALGDLCTRLGAFPLGDSNGYLAAEEFDSRAAEAKWVAAYRTVSSGRADEKRIRAELRLHGLYVDAVKVRGVKEDPERWRRVLKGGGPEQAVLALYPVGKSLRYALLEPWRDSG